MDSEVINSGKPLYLVTSTRVYRPQEAPPEAQAKASAKACEKDLDTDRDYLTSWEAISESLDANNCGIDSQGNRVSLDECRTEGSGYNVGD